jgi:N-methylhydantoinase B
MSRAAAKRPTVLDPISLEVLRNRLDAIVEESAATIERTAISPVVTEAKDFSSTLLDGQGGLVSGGGYVKYHWRACVHAVRTTIGKFGDTIAAGDVFLANDPHCGGGLHPGDVLVQRPIFAGGHRVAWAVLSAHMIDIGGMVPGSFAPQATDCFQEALRIPPVRLFRKGEEMTDVWDIFRNNVRLSVLVEMDLRSLVAGGHVAQQQVAALVDEMGVEPFIEGVDALIDMSEVQMRQRISLIADGTYTATSWTEWGAEFFKSPCTLTVDGDRLIFDFQGASDQAPHFFNSKPYIIESGVGQAVAWLLASDLPYTQGLFTPIELRCPEGTILNSTPPAPINAAHMHVAINAAEAAMECVRLAVAASPDSPARNYLTGWESGSGMGLSMWSCRGLDGTPDIFLLMEGTKTGSSAAAERDGLDLTWSLVGADFPTGFADIEILEAWYPLLVTEKRPRPGVNGAGEWRSGAGCQMSIQPYGTDHFVGTMLGMRRWIPLPGAAGGLPGATTQFVVHHASGISEDVPTEAWGVHVGPGELFEVRCASGGGFGDPLDRRPDLVLLDVQRAGITAEEAFEAYAVVIRSGKIDARATQASRRQELRNRLRRATPPVRPPSKQELTAYRDDAPALPLYQGIIQRGLFAVSEHSGAVLAVAPSHWTSGCPELNERHSPDGPPVTVRSYLDPLTGRCLFVEVVPEGEQRSFECLPRRWTRIETPAAGVTGSRRTQRRTQRRPRPISVASR